MAPSRVRQVALTSSSSHFTARLLGLLVDQRLDEGVEVARVEAGGGGGEAARHVEVADDLDAVVVHHLAGLAPARQLPPRSTARSTMTEPGFMDSTIARRDELRRRPAGDQRRGDDDVLLGDVGGDELGLLGLVLRRHLLGVAAGGLGLLELLVLDGDELGARGSRPAPWRPGARRWRSPPRRGGGRWRSPAGRRRRRP